MGLHGDASDLSRGDSETPLPALLISALDILSHSLDGSFDRAWRLHTSPLRLVGFET
jgi:hypothetical protein